MQPELQLRHHRHSVFTQPYVMACLIRARLPFDHGAPQAVPVLFAREQVGLLVPMSGKSTFFRHCRILWTAFHNAENIPK
jgi:hypothetical protein